MASYARTASPARTNTPVGLPLPVPTSNPAALFGVVEAKGTANDFTYNIVAIAGLDGIARAKATFAPMPGPYVPCAGAVVPRSAHVAAGKVFFADGTGVVRSLAASGQVSEVTRFPLGPSQQMMSFAVSPDGSKLMGTIFTFPARLASTNSPCDGTNRWGPGDFSLDVYSAPAGGAARLLDHASWPQTSSPEPFLMAEWNALGPLATYPAIVMSQGGGPHHYEGQIALVDYTTGKVVRQLADPIACWVEDVAPGGDFACQTAGQVSVRRPDGSEIWRLSSATVDYYDSYLSPDENRLATFPSSNSFAVAAGRDGRSQSLPMGFIQGGWLDSGTVIGWGNANDVAIVRLSDPGTVVDLGFKGLFVGALS